MRSTTNDLLVRLKDNQPSAYKEVYRLAFRPCATLIQKNGGTMDDAKDIFQEAILIFSDKLQQKSFNLNCKVTTYLYSIVRNLWLRRLDQDKKEGLKLIIDENDYEYIRLEDGDLEQKEIKEMQLDLVEEVMGTLQKKCQQVLIAYYYKRFSLKEVAQQMGYSYDFVKQKRKRCVDRLKKEILQRWPLLAE